MPFIDVHSNSINKKRSVLGSEGVKNASIIESTLGLDIQTEAITELIIEYPAGENLLTRQIVSIVNGVAYKASNLKATDRPAHGIVLTDANTGQTVKVQIYGVCSLDFNLTTGKNMYLRYGTPNYSLTPLITPDANEDGFQIIGRMLTADILLIDIKPFQQIT